MIQFTKMHGLGNDFPIIDCRDGQRLLTPEEVVKLADRKRGIGFDQVIHICAPKSDQADIFLDMYNADGSTLEACGNGTRCAARYFMDDSGQDSCVIETVAGLLRCKRADDDMIMVDMGVPNLEWQAIPLSKDCDTQHLPLDGDPIAVNIGNPHCVFFVDDVETISLTELGPKFENDPLFPNRTNVEFVQILSRNHVRMRVWERGAGVTEACGSGACAVAVASILRGFTDRDVRITLDGGDLIMHWREDDNHILMTGPATYVFDGTLKSM